MDWIDMWEQGGTASQDNRIHMLRKHRFCEFDARLIHVLARRTTRTPLAPFVPILRKSAVFS